MESATVPSDLETGVARSVATSLPSPSPPLCSPPDFAPASSAASAGGTASALSKTRALTSSTVAFPIGSLSLTCPSRKCLRKSPLMGH